MKELSDPRRAGQVTRYHTQTRIKEQSVAEHSWQCLRIALTLWPQASRDLLIAIAFHDLEEGITGDLPYGPKPKDWEQIRQAAWVQMRKDWAVPPVPSLTEEDQQRLKLVDLIEMLEWANQEINLGNNYAKIVKQRIVADLVTRDLPPEVIEYVHQRSMKANP